MANNYFNFGDPVVAGTRIVSARYNGDMAAIAAAFDRVPDSNDLYLSLLGYGVATGSTPNVYNVTIPVGAPLTAYTVGMQVTFLADKSSTGAAQLNVNGLGNKLIVSSGNVGLPSGSIIAGSYYTLRYDGVNFQMQTALYALFDQAAAQAAASAAAALVSQNAAAASAAAALVSQQAAASSASAAAGSASAASTSAGSASSAASSAAGSASSAASSAGSASTSASNAAGSANAAAASAAAALVSQNAAAGSASAAAASAAAALVSQNAAAASATAAANSAASIDPATIMRKAQNLNDVASKPDARTNLDVYSKAESDARRGIHLGQVIWHTMRSRPFDGGAALDGQVVDPTGTFADLRAHVAAGNEPTCTEAVWQADPGMRGCYVLDIGDGRMRLPDRNGVQPGSIFAPGQRGDGGSLAAGTIQRSGVPNITGSITFAANSGAMRSDAIATGALKVGNEANRQNNPATTANNVGRSLQIDAKGSSDVYQDGLTEVRTNMSAGCYMVIYAGRALNAGSLDALTLSTRIESVNTDLQAKNIATNARIGSAVIDAGTLTANNQTVNLTNPFGANTPVSVTAEIQYNGVWCDVGWVLSSAGTFGTRAMYVEGQGIVVRTGAALTSIPANNGHILNTPDNYKGPAPCRVLVRKISP